MRSRFFMPAMAGVALTALLAPGCNESTAPTRFPVVVTEREFNIALDRATASSGEVVFQVRNVGEDHHEFLVIRTDRAPDALPTEANGSYLEDGPGTQLIDELDDIAPGQTQVLVVNLAAGNYVLICNMVMVEDDGSVEVHYQNGMRTAFRVE
jgi:hypothetical protein